MQTHEMTRTAAATVIVQHGTFVSAWRVAFGLSLLALTVRVLLVPDALFIADEYYYSKTIQLWWSGEAATRHVTALPGRGDPSFPNSLFFAIYQSCYLFGGNYYVAAKLLNVGFAALMALAVWRVAAPLTSATTAGWIAVLTLWLPASSYYAYFVPEPLYECLVWWGIAFHLTLVERHRLWSAVVIGAFLGAAFLAKPNAVALLAAVNITVLATCWSFPHRGQRILPGVTSAALVNIGFLVTAFLLNLITTGQLEWDPFGQFYRTGLAKVTEVSASSSFLVVTAKYAAMYTWILALVFGPALNVFWAGRDRFATSSRDFTFFLFTGLGLAALLLGSVKVGVNWERVYENHVGAYSSRYMSVLFPLLIIGFVAALPHAITKPRMRRLVGFALAVLALSLTLMFEKTGNTLQLREVFWLKFLLPHGCILMAAGLLVTQLYYALAAAPRQLVYAAVLAAWAAGSAVELTRTDHIQATHGPAFNYADAARVANALIPPAWRDKGLLLSTDRPGAILFMFRYAGFVPVRLLSSTEALVADTMAPQTPWAVYLGEARPARTEGCVTMPSALLCITNPNVR